jgi:hypothetical protein
MAYTQTDLQALQDAYKRGVRRVSMGDRTVEYESMAALRTAIADVGRALAAAAGSVSPHHGVATFSDG